jgi:hypothetical protein
MRHDFDASIAEVGDGDGVAEVSGAAVDLDALLQESREGGGVEDAVLRWLGCVDDELRSFVSAILARLTLGNRSYLMRHLLALFWNASLAAGATGWSLLRRHRF